MMKGGGGLCRAAAAASEILNLWAVSSRVVVGPSNSKTRVW